MRASAHLAIAVALVGCASELPPAAEPAREVPPVTMPAHVPDGRGLVIVDTPDGPSAVTKITGHGYGTDSEGNSVAVDTERNLCPVTPCVADLRKGAQTVVVRSADGRDYGAIDVQVNDNPVVIRHMYEQTHRGGGFLPGIILTAIGGSFALSGGITYAAGRGVADTPTPPGAESPSHTTESIGLAFGLTGAAMMITGGLLWALARGTHRAGATTIFYDFASTSAAAPSPP